MLKDDAIAGIVRSRLARTSGFLDSKLSKERERLYEYRDGILPRPLNERNSKFYSTDVSDTCDMMEAQLLETFAGAYQPVKFQPRGPMDVEKARLDTEVVNWVVTEQNDGFGIMETVIQDGLYARMGVAKVWWEESEEEEELEWEGEDGDTSALTSFLATNPDAEPSEIEMDANGQVQRATLKSKTDTSQVRIEAVPPEEYGVSKGAKSPQDADLQFHRTSLTRSEIAARWPDWTGDIEDLPSGFDWIAADSEKMIRTQDVGGNDTWGMDSDEQESGRRVEVFECYTKLDINETNGKSSRSGRKLWKIVMAGGEILEKTQVKRAPFVVWVPLPRSHTMWGSSFADRLVPTQNAKTALMRGILDNVVQSTNPRWQVIRGGLQNPAELMEGKVGGIVNVKSLEAVAPLQSLPLNPFVFQALQMLDGSKEQVSGISALSQGLNKDAISKQNSAGMVEQLVSMSQVRQKVVARRFAEHFLAPLYREVLLLLVENAKQSLWVEIGGDYVQVDPTAMEIRKHVSVDFSLGYGEKDQEAAKYGTIFQVLTAASQTDPAIAQAFGPQQKYTVLSRGILAKGIKDVAAILPDPSKMQPPGPNPMQQAELAKTQADVAQQHAQAQATMAKIQREEQKDAAAHQIEMMKLDLERQKIEGELALKSQELALKDKIETAELKIATIGAAQKGAEVKAFVSP